MKSHVTLSGVRLFGIKPLGNGCRFGIKVSSKRQDGTYTKGVFINCKHKEMLQEAQNYTLEGFFGDNEYNNTNTLELIVTSATPEYNEQRSEQKYAPKVTVNRNPEPQYQKWEDEDSSEIPF